MRDTMLGACLLALAAIALVGCDPIGRHKVLSTIFDGMPTLPPPEQICSEYAEKRIAEVKAELSGKNNILVVADTQSQHAPYQEKKCNDCHDQTKQNGLITAPAKLCSVCHSGFVKGKFVHGPVAVGECSACHQPHSSKFPSLLKTEQNAICSTCHREKRLTSAMHGRLAAQGIGCTDCHDPHFGSTPFFLK